MSRWSGTRITEAAERREAKRHQRELAQQAKEATKLSALEQARLEVETYENAVETLLSMHKERATEVDWLSVAASLPPVSPSRLTRHELKALHRLTATASSNAMGTAVAQAREQDEQEYQAELKRHATSLADWEKMTTLARRILTCDSTAYMTVAEELTPFAELVSLGCSVSLTIHSARLVEARLRTSGKRAIPQEAKSLTATGKVSTKPMPKGRFVEIYQDYVCACVLRVARELFALLPIDVLLITAYVELASEGEGRAAESPILSVAIPRAKLDRLDFDRLDPSDSIMGMTHRGDLKTSRSTGDFEPVDPLTVSDWLLDAPTSEDLASLASRARRLRVELAVQGQAAVPEPDEFIEAVGEDR